MTLKFKNIFLYFKQEVESDANDENSKTLNNRSYLSLLHLSCNAGHMMLLFGSSRCACWMDISSQARHFLRFIKLMMPWP